MRVGDLVKRKMMHRGDYYHIMKMFRNDFGALRCEVLCLTDGTLRVFRPSELKVLNASW